jgi:hypothetical protein
MTSPSIQGPAPAAIDPLAAFTAGAFTAARHPVPLIATRFDVEIDSGLAIVATSRVFRNAEADTIEATITFPVPVHAVLFRLEARIGERVLQARAMRARDARATYEAAIDRGKSAVLHEEVLRGVHMLSLAHVPPGAEIAVSATWAITLTQAEGRSTLRIPLTVGDIYGRSPLADCDDFALGGPVQMADLSVRCRDAVATIAGRALDGGRTQVPLNAPIDIAVTGWHPAELSGRAADGSAATLRIEPSGVADAALDVALLIDHSGSMSSACDTDRLGLSKHGAVVASLAAAADRLGRTDMIDLWEFDDTCRHVAKATGGPNLRTLLPLLSGPQGGTEIGEALAQVARVPSGRDVLLVTDGKSHALDVHALARTGRRFAVVLVGADSLEANVGHLAALTGGEIFVSSGADLTAMLAAALASLRRAPAATGKTRPQAVTAARAGMTIGAAWRDAPAEDTRLGRAVAAMAASLVLPTLDSAGAAVLAEAEGLVTHLTSLVLVDEAGGVHQGVPATRKVALPRPLTSGRMFYEMEAPPAAARAYAAPRLSDAAHEARVRPSIGQMLRSFHIGGAALPPEPRAPMPARPAAPMPPVRTLADLAARIDWDDNPQGLSNGDLSRLESDVAHAVRNAAARAAIRKLAAALGLDPLVLMVALMARAASSQSRTAARLARTLLARKACTDTELDAAIAMPVN